MEKAWTTVAVVVLVALLVLSLAALYFFPTFVAVTRRHHQAGLVFGINLLAGWTLAGWVVAFLIAASATRAPSAPPPADHAPTRPG